MKRESAPQEYTCRNCPERYYHAIPAPQKSKGLMMHFGESYCTLPKRARHLKSRDLNRRAPEWCPKRKVPNTLRIYYYRSSETYVLDNTNSAIVTLKEVVPVDIETIGLNIRKCRNAKKMRQEDLAQKANVSSNYISAVERGVKIPSVETLIDIMNALGVSADMIFCDVIDAGVTEKNNQLDAKVSQLSTKDRKTVYDVLDLLVRDLSK